MSNDSCHSLSPSNQICNQEPHPFMSSLSPDPDLDRAYYRRTTNCGATMKNGACVWEWKGGEEAKTCCHSITKTGGFSFPKIVGKRNSVGIAGWFCPVWKLKLRSSRTSLGSGLDKQTVTSCLCVLIQCTRQKWIRNGIGSCCYSVGF